MKVEENLVQYKYCPWKTSRGPIDDCTQNVKRNLQLNAGCVGWDGAPQLVAQDVCLEVVMDAAEEMGHKMSMLLAQGQN